MYGLRIQNPSGHLVIDSEAKGLYCVGRATLTSSANATGLSSNSIPGRQAGYQIYTFNYVGRILVAMDLPENYYVAMEEMTYSAGVWTFRCQCGNTLDVDGFIDTQIEFALWIFAWPNVNVPSGSYGLALYGSDGSLTWDLSKQHPLWIRGANVFPGNSSAQNIVLVQRPVMLGRPLSFITDDDFVSGNTYKIKRRYGAWFRSSPTVVTQRMITKQQYRYFGTEPIGLQDGDLVDTTAFIIEGQFLP